MIGSTLGKSTPPKVVEILKVCSRAEWRRAAAAECHETAAGGHREGVWRAFRDYPHHLRHCDALTWGSAHQHRGQA